MKDLKITKTILNEKSDVLSDYFKEINKYKILSPEEEYNLAIKASEGDEYSKNLLINSNLRFVVTCAKQYVNQGVPLLDLIAAGNEGLVISVEKFKPEKGFRLLSFAVWYIRREILKEIYNNGRTVRYPITFISRVYKVKKACEKFSRENGREPTDDELLDLTNLTQKQYDKTILDKSYCQSLDTPLYEDIKLQDVIPNNDGEEDFIQDALLKCLETLNSREKKIIKEYFGIGCPARKIQEIAEDLKLGPERIRQIKKSALEKLKKYKNILQIYVS